MGGNAEPDGPLAGARGGGLGLFGAKSAEALVELGDLAAGVHDAVHAGPGRMALGVDIEANGVARFAVAGARGVLGAVRHHDVDFVIIGVDAGFHGGAFAQSGVARPIPTGHAKGGDIAFMRGEGKKRALPV